MNQGSFSVKYGLIIALLLVVVDALLHVLGLDLKPGYSSIDTVVLIAAIIIACTLFSKANGGYVTFGQTFLSGLYISLIVAVVMAVWTALKFVIWPDLGDQMRAMTDAQMEARGNIGEDQRRMVGKVTDIVTSPAVLAVIAFFSYAVMGTIAALIGGAVAKKNSGPRPDMLDQYGSPKR